VGALTRDFEAEGLNRVTLGRLVADGAVERVGRGLYTIPNAEVTEHHTLSWGLLMTMGAAARGTNPGSVSSRCLQDESELRGIAVQMCAGRGKCAVEIG
jgi:hypothetical protein